MGKFQKGQSGNPKGREKGSKNKTTTEFKEHLNRLLEESAPSMHKWLKDIAAEDPVKAFDILSKFAEYIHPKLQRTEQDVNHKGQVDLNAKVTFIGHSDSKEV